MKVGAAIAALISLISFVGYGRVYFFDGFAITKFAWIIAIGCIVCGVIICIKDICKHFIGKMTEKALKKTKIVAAISVLGVVVLAIVVAVLMNSTGSKIALFDKMVSKIPSVQSYSSPERENVNEILEKLELDEKSTTCAIDKEFIEEYLKTHSAEEFFDNLNVVYEYMCGRYGNVDEDHSFYKMKKIITTATEVANIELKSIDFSTEGAAGFYTENAEEYPPIETWEEEGRFYSSSGEGGHYQTRTCQCEYTYYGDFAVRHGTGYHYDKGRYEWQNGIFYDELPSWNAYDHYCLEYKGRTIVYGDDFATDKFWSDAKSIKYFIVGDKTYFLYNSTEQNFGQVWYEFSK